MSRWRNFALNGRRIKGLRGYVLVSSERQESGRYLNYGWGLAGIRQAAHHSVMLRPDGRIAAWRGWFRREPHDMPGEVERMLEGVAVMMHHLDLPTELRRN